jgi:hypothetical protein
LDSFANDCEIVNDAEALPHRQSAAGYQASRSDILALQAGEKRPINPWDVKRRASSSARAHPVIPVERRDQIEKIVA